MKKLLVLSSAVISLIIFVSIIILAQPAQPVLTRGGGIGTNDIRLFLVNSVGDGKLLAINGTSVIGIPTNSVGSSNIIANTFTTNANDVGTGAIVSQSGAILGVNDTDTNKFLKSFGSSTASSFDFIRDTHIVFTDITNGNASTVRHGFVPKLPNDATKFYDGVGNFSGGSAAPIQNFYSITQYFTVAKGGRIDISNNITVLTNGVFILSNLPSPAVLVLSTNHEVTNATLSGLTLGNNNLLSASGGGGTPGFTISSGVITANQTNIDNGAAGTNAFMYVGGSGNAVTNGNNLLTAYTWAKTATPHAVALTAVNRYTIFLLPGTFDLGTNTLTLNTQFIDIEGISDNTGVTEYVGGLGGVYDYGDTVIKSSGNVISVTVSDVAIRKLAVITSSAGSRAITSTGFSASFKASNLLLFNSAGSINANSAMVTDVAYAGVWTDVRCWNPNSFGGGNPGTFAGTYLRCKGGADAFVGGAFSGGAITLSATCVDCEAGGESFGGGGNRTVTLSGTFIRCRFVNPTSAGGSFFGNSGNSATFSGTFIDIVSENSDSFYGTLTGTMYGIRSTVANNPLTVNGGTVLGCYLPAATLTLTSGTVRSCVFGNSSLNQAGTGTGIARVGGTLKVNTTTTGNVGAGEDNLITYSVPAATLSTTGDYLEFDCFGTFAANANTKNLKVYFGATAIFTSTALIYNGVDWRAHGKIIRTSATAQKAITEFTIAGTLLGATTTTTTTSTTSAETLANAITFKITGEDSGGVPVNDSVVQHGMVLKWYPNN